MGATPKEGAERRERRWGTQGRWALEAVGCIEKAATGGPPKIDAGIGD